MKCLILALMAGLMTLPALAQDIPKPDQEMSWPAFIRDCLDGPDAEMKIIQLAMSGDQQHPLCASTVIMALSEGLDRRIFECTERLTLSSLAWPVDYLFGITAHHRPLSAYEAIKGAADIACSREYLNGDFEGLAAK